MKRFTEILACSLVVLLCLGLAQSLCADPILLSINANYLDGDFCHTGGDYGNGVLEVCDNADIVVEYDTGQVTYVGGCFTMTTPLCTDNSSDGLACGFFQTGTLVITDGEGDNLLTAQLTLLRLDEVFDGCGLLAGAGTFEVTGGSLADDFGQDYGEVVQITFQLSCGTIDDFSSDFSGVSNVTLMPIPEPGTLLLLATGIITGPVWMRRRKKT